MPCIACTVPWASQLICGPGPSLSGFSSHVCRFIFAFLALSALCTRCEMHMLVFSGLLLGDRAQHRSICAVEISRACAYLWRRRGRGDLLRRFVFLACGPRKKWRACLCQMAAFARALRVVACESIITQPI